MKEDQRQFVQGDGTEQQTDIATYRLKRPRGLFSDNIFIPSKSVQTEMLNSSKFGPQIDRKDVHRKSFLFCTDLMN